MRKTIYIDQLSFIMSSYSNNFIRSSEVSKTKQKLETKTNFLRPLKNRHAIDIAPNTFLPTSTAKILTSEWLSHACVRHLNPPDNWVWKLEHAAKRRRPIKSVLSNFYLIWLWSFISLKIKRIWFARVYERWIQVLKKNSTEIIVDTFFYILKKFLRW